MKNLFLILPALFFTGLLRIEAQDHFSIQSLKLDTIYANAHKNVALFFPEPIRQGITGAQNFVFTYNREKEQYFGVLQATPGEESNLLVIGANGGVYSYILKYRETLERVNYFFGEVDKIANEKPIKQDSISPNRDFNNNDDLRQHYEKTAQSLMRTKQGIRRTKNRENCIIFSIKDIVFEREELYFVMEIENRSSLDYDFGFLTIATQSRKKGKRKSDQTLAKEPVFTFAVPDKIQKYDKRSFVYVLPKFSLNSDYRLTASLHEKEGVRDINLNISHRFINNPN